MYRKILCGALAAAILTVPAYAAELSDLFDKGTQWHLTIDDWDGPMVVQDLKVSSSKSDPVVLNATVGWQGQQGRLTVSEYTRDPRRSVLLIISLPNGEDVEAEGFMARESDAFMAGPTRFATDDVTYFGAWYATRFGGGRDDQVTVSGSLMAPAGSVSGDNQIEVPDGAIVGTQTGSAQAWCRITGAVGGMTRFVKSAWLQPSNFTRQAIEMPVGADGHFSGNIPAGEYQFDLVSRGKVELVGVGLNQNVNCPAGGSARVTAKVDGVSE